MNTEQMTAPLAAWAKSRFGSNARISDVETMPGNSGFSFSFVAHPEPSHPPTKLAIRLAHPAAAPRRNASMARQVAVLKSVAQAGVPVPLVVDHNEQSEWFTSPYFVTEFIEGESTRLFEPARAGHWDGQGLTEVFEDALSALALLHNTDWGDPPPVWCTATGLAGELGQWLPTLHKSSNASWVRRGDKLYGLLSETIPPSTDPTVFHGDYYSNNWIFASSRLRAVVDWEIAGYGERAIDLGWLCMMYDDRAWNSQRHMWRMWNPTPSFITDAYEAAGGQRVDNLDWFRALAGYKLACVIGRNYELHRRGLRRDRAWDVLGESFDSLTSRAASLLTGLPQRQAGALLDS